MAARRCELSNIQWSGVGRYSGTLGESQHEEEKIECMNNKRNAMERIVVAARRCELSNIQWSGVGRYSGTLGESQHEEENCNRRFHTCYSYPVCNCSDVNTIPE